MLVNQVSWLSLNSGFSFSQDSERDWFLLRAVGESRPLCLRGLQMAVFTCLFSVPQYLSTLPLFCVHVVSRVALSQVLAWPGCLGGPLVSISLLLRLKMYKAVVFFLWVLGIELRSASY